VDIRIKLTGLTLSRTKVIHKNFVDEFKQMGIL